MKKERYQIIYVANIWNGRQYTQSECLCTVKTASGDDCIIYGKEEAEQRVAELVAAGYEARCEVLRRGTAWFDDENWLG